jgi:DNA-directed RNA polymerase alpha subunit
MIEADADVEVLDREAHIATVGEGGKLAIEMRVKNGRGYVSADRNFDEDLPVGYIPIDSVHSPVRKVNYTVEAARLGQMTDYDKLTLEVWTNGSIKPTDAVGLGAKLLKDHMSIFIAFEEETPRVEEAAERAYDPRQEYLSRSRSAQRAGHAAHQELRPQVVERNQGVALADEPAARHEGRRARPRPLAAAGHSRSARRGRATRTVALRQGTEYASSIRI